MKTYYKAEQRFHPIPKDHCVNLFPVLHLYPAARPADKPNQHASQPCLPSYDVQSLLSTLPRPYKVRRFANWSDGFTMDCKMTLRAINDFYVNTSPSAYRTSNATNVAGCVDIARCIFRGCVDSITNYFEFREPACDTVPLPDVCLNHVTLFVDQDSPSVSFGFEYIVFVVRGFCFHG